MSPFICVETETYRIFLGTPSCLKQFVNLNSSQRSISPCVAAAIYPNIPIALAAISWLISHRGNRIINSKLKVSVMKRIHRCKMPAGVCILPPRYPAHERELQETKDEPAFEL